MAIILFRMKCHTYGLRWCQGVIFPFFFFLLICGLHVYTGLCPPAYLPFLFFPPLSTQRSGKHMCNYACIAHDDLAVPVQLGIVHCSVGLESDAALLPLSGKCHMQNVIGVSRY